MKPTTKVWLNEQWRFAVDIRTRMVGKRKPQEITEARINTASGSTKWVQIDKTDMRD